MSQRTNISDDLIWEIIRSNNAYLVKRKTGGGVQFSRDPFNLTNKHSRTHAGFVNGKAVSVQANGEKGLTLHTKKSDSHHKPGSSVNKTTFKSGKSNRSSYKAIANQVGKNSYRSDLNESAIKRASAILDSQRPKPDAPEKKPRGAKAKKTEA